MVYEDFDFSRVAELKGKSGIYRLSVLEHSYIGSSKNLYSRLKEHYHDLKKNQHTNNFLQKVVNKYGILAIKVDIIEFCEPSIRLEREKYWIDELKSDMNLQDPVDHTLSEESKKKLSESIKRGRELGKYVTYYETSTIDCFDYFGNYITTYSTKEEAAIACGIRVDDVSACIKAYRKNSQHTGLPRGKAVNGYRFRYSCSKVPQLEFEIHPRMVGSYFNFYYENDKGERSLAFTNVRDCWEFIAAHCRDEKITIIPVLKSRESWELRQKTEDHNGSASETK